MKKRRNTEMPDIKGKTIKEGDRVKVTDRFGSNEWIVVWENYAFSLVDADGDGDKYGVYTRRFALHGDSYEIVKVKK